MPTYTFQCDNCNYQEDFLLTISKRNEPKKCPKCQNLMTRLIGKGGGFILKGKGFYCNREQDI